MLLQYILFFAVAFPAVEPARILGIFPMPSISHQIVFRSLTEELAKRGHTLVILTPNPSHYTDPVYSNITEIDVKDESYKIFNSHFNFMRLREENSDVFETFRVFSKFVLPLMEYQMQVPAIKKLLEDPDQKFDLCIFEALFMLTYPLKDRFNCSMITFSSLTGMINNFESLGVPTNPIIYMDMFSSYSENLNFWERMHLVYNHINFYYLYYWKYLPRYNELSRKLFGDSVRSIDDIEKDADIFFVNVQPLLRGIRPIVPSVVFLGSIHIKKPKPLPSMHKTSFAKSSVASVSYKHNMLKKLFASILLISIVKSARILGVFPTPSISHQVVFRALMEELAKRGHHLMVMTTDPVDYTDPEYSNLTQIDVHNISYPIFREKINFVKMKEHNTFAVAQKLHETMLEICVVQLLDPKMQKLMNDPTQKFDLCFIESLWKIMFHLKDHFNCSLILMSTLSGTIYTYDRLGVPTNPTLYTDALFKYYGTSETFSERLDVVYDYVRYFFYFWYTDSYYIEASKKIFNNPRPLDDVLKSADMYFANGHPILDGIRPTVPSFVFLGSMHIKKPKPLPSDLKKILDTAKNGFIYLSFGSNVKSVDLAEKKRNSFLMAFKDMPYTVLWKWENDTMPNKPKNVYISKWMPQQDILAHPNIKVFVTHGGQQSVEEAIDRKVPMVGMPFLVDQDINVKKMYKFGIGLGIDLTTITVEIIRDAVNEVITNPGYRQNISKLHDLLYDHPQSSLERAVWWTEYVLRHGGASHLRSPAINVPFYQYFLLDIIGFILICCFLIFAIIVAIIKCILHIRTSQFDLNINMNHLKKFQ